MREYLLAPCIGEARDAGKYWAAAPCGVPDVSLGLLVLFAGGGCGRVPGLSCATAAGTAGGADAALLAASALMYTSTARRLLSVLNRVFGLHHAATSLYDGILGCGGGFQVGSSRCSSVMIKGVAAFGGVILGAARGVEGARCSPGGVISL